MRYISVDLQAAEDIISDHFLQSVEFEQGSNLAQLICGLLVDARLSARVRVLPQNDGLLLLATGEKSREVVVFDLEAAPLFDKRNPGSALLCFQRVLRFAIRYWKKFKLSHSERLIPNSTKAVVFPYPISQKTQFRISIELNPDSRRQAKRERAGRFLLVYRCACDEGDGPHEVAEITNFRRAVAAMERVRSAEIRASNAPTVAPITALNVTSLEDRPRSHLPGEQGYDNWRRFLTVKQRKFIDSELCAPHRIEGPAGTGKTLCLVLKSIAMLRLAESAGQEHRALIVAHSEATKRTIEQLILANDPAAFLGAESGLRPQSIKLTTLHQLCGEVLRTEIAESEFLDRDAMESKMMQLLYVSDSFEEAMEQDFATYQDFLSPAFASFLGDNDRWATAQMLQHEISVVIKGRAGEDLDCYRKLPRLKYGLPVENDSDRGFIFVIFKKYQERLQAAAQFDTDDIVLTTIGQLNTPIWRRRRRREGYNSLFIDETHLFNINELSLFHYLTRSETEYPIAYSVDRSQAVGDRGWTDELFDEALTPGADARSASIRTDMESIFRCSPDIVNLAFWVTSAGATLFTNFEDPLKAASSMFTDAEERKCASPVYLTAPNDDAMVIEAFERAERMAREMEVLRCEVAVVAFSDELFGKIEAYASDRNKPNGLCTNVRSI